MLLDSYQSYSGIIYLYMKYLKFSPIVVDTLFKDKFNMLLYSLQLLLIRFHKYLIQCFSNVMSIGIQLLMM